LSSSLAGSGIVNLCLSSVFSLDVGSVLLFLVACDIRFPLSDGGVLVAVSTCAVLRGGGYYLVTALSVAYLLTDLVSFFAVNNHS
jgi:hypothetical protein